MLEQNLNPREKIKRRMEERKRLRGEKDSLSEEGGKEAIIDQKHPALVQSSKVSVISEEQSTPVTKKEEKKEALVDVHSKYRLQGESLTQNAIDALVKRYKVRSQKLTKQNKALEELNKMKSEFAAMATHELKVPIKNIIASIDNILEKSISEISPGVKDELNMMLNNANRVMSQIQQILDFSKAEASDEGFILEKVDLSELIHSIAELGLKPLADQKHMQIKLDLQEPLVVFCSKQKITHVLNNLVENAIKYTGEGTLISISAKKDGENVVIKVSDTGPGIDAKHLPRLFDKFYRASKTTDGTGLGLAICKQIIEKHKGTITVDSELGKGTAFTMIFPVKSEKEEKSDGLISDGGVVKEEETQ